MTAFTGAAVVPATAGAVLGMNPATASAAPAAPSGSPKAIAQKIIKDHAQFACFDKIVTHESHWDVGATNASSGAYGLVQALPGGKMASAGADWRTNPATQIEWGLDYMKDRYGSPCDAWSAWQAQGWY
ncbi:transglycosylase SLT domain-containing protein [Streptomyces sp. NPDC048389]|uniref:aggregation-promoting factor C-terminal-like domain-containing protein n=1 Tax=Streptomyces sp. NPDC048389 TaxID=3154622 RepID=UPI00345158C7